MSITLFTNGTILTLDDENRSCTSMAIDNNTIVAIGDDLKSQGQFKGCREIDLYGRTVIPGFNDNHIHLNFYGDSIGDLDFSGMNREQILSSLKKRYKSPRKNEVISGSRWDIKDCPDPNRYQLDELFPDNPVILSQYGGHAYWVNSVTLKKMKINRVREDNGLGYIERDEHGEPTGIIKDLQRNSFMEKLFIRKLISKKMNKKNCTLALEKCRTLGLTSLQDNTWSFVTLIVLKKLASKGELSSRICCWSFGESPFFRWLFDLMPLRNRRISKGPVKYFIDGTFSSKTAWLNEPYTGEPDNCGYGKPKEELIKILEKEIRKGKQTAFHAIGDRAVKEFLDALEELSQKYDYIPRLRIRLEHSQLISGDDLIRIKKMGVIVCAQPSALNNPEKDIDILGQERAERAYPFRTLIDRDIPLSFGSDCPGEDTLNPFQIIHFAVNRKGTEKISVLEAMKCYTRGSAYAEFKETIKGTLSRGKLADFLVLSDNPLETEEQSIREIKVLQTWVGGDLVYDSL